MNRLLLLFLLFAAIGHTYAQEASGPLRKQIRSVRVEGNTRTDTAIILREMSAQPGDSVATDSIPAFLEKNRLRIFNLSLFTEVSVHSSNTADGSIDITVHLRERWNIIPEIRFQLADRNFNVWWYEHNHDLSRANLELTIRDKNFRGNMENLAFTVQTGYTQKLGLQYYKPYIDRKKQHGLGAAVSFSRSREVAYKTDSNKLLFYHNPGSFFYRQSEAAIYYTYRPAYAFRHMLQLSYETYRVDDSVLLLNPLYYDHDSRKLRIMELVYRLDINKVDNWNYPLKGFKFVGYVVQRFGLEGMVTQTVMNVEAGLFKNPFPRWYVSGILRGKLSTPDQPQPYQFQAALGTRTDYVRGYEYYVIDGAQFGLLRLDIKRSLLNREYKNIPLMYLSSIPLRIYPKVFADIGYVAKGYPYSNRLGDRLLYSAGIGVDIVTAYDFKIRLEYTWNHMGQRDLFLHTNSE